MNTDFTFLPEVCLVFEQILFDEIEPKFQDGQD